ncbi:methionine biosynthesis protein MetW [Candidatus Parcubacteria bacterium]|nr:methionine biosynthesis protein MetW [Candidatus Parcubacteria bacterium]
MFYFSNSGKRGFTNITAVDYDAYWKERGFKINEKLKEREVIILNEIPAHAKVLDIGCGNSLLPVRLKEKGCDVTVADISTVVLNEYKKIGFKTLHIHLEDTAHLQFASPFDYIIMSEVLEHTRNPEEILTALRPYTRTFVLTIPNSAFYRYRFHLMFTGTFIRQWVHHPGEHLRYWSHTDFLAWLNAFNFNVKKAVASNGFDSMGIPFYTYFPNLFGHQICYFVET